MSDFAAMAIHLRGHVLPGDEVRDVYVVDGRITFEEPAGGAETILDAGWLTPGLVDAHAHLPMASPAGDAASEEERVRASLHAHLHAGVLVVREPGSPTAGSLPVATDDLPHLQTAGHFIAPTGRYFRGLAREIDPADLADVVREEGAASGAWVKLIGDFWEDGPVEPNWTAAQFHTAAETAHAAGARIAVHAVSSEAIALAVDAGFDTIEHGTGLTDELVAAMADAGVTFTPTMSIEPPLRAMLGTMRPDVGARMNELLDDQPRLVAAAARAGVRLLAGTDAGMVPHGVVAGEIGRMLAAGVAPDVALGAGSWSAREYLGYPGIEEGAPADVVAFTQDPRSDAAVLSSPALIIRNGVVVRG
jgi:imidazolonepropionase-like amidohydrolase